MAPSAIRWFRREPEAAQPAAIRISAQRFVSEAEAHERVCRWLTRTWTSAPTRKEAETYGRIARSKMVALKYERLTTADGEPISFIRIGDHEILEFVKGHWNVVTLAVTLS